ncbi:MAG: hypothetical protein A3C50_02970 [Candidatus Staskawiczbacteria bacterium RIFCSPHIGHO2_02_FULL_43_16]|uniref:DUF5659 domain-containing protein n=1 Tax=Candidatus Staskawiczbacteria bacterium RIFCSPHIGHO2_01_FULL_41_41 TaxID=1802203 RepID=A0A1G2HRY0_9BACT|nr:MAG: hypothetical protein A2822_01125 [Candidatus Staskawiczbacteria bacterium RIFCSPHIGHO2_01_FULL_41_41]OGZ68577.1 MAG: hypothetical protein A3C50_02970 [Candidatus Staskawiczbacteria bacterium RIFCSPHIGHO2_02_FULL_43_16]
MKKLDQNSIYQTSDLPLATVISLSFSIKSVDRENPRKAQFIFERNSKLDALIEDYWNGNLKVEPQQFFNQLRIVKARLYGEN